MNKKKLNKKFKILIMGLPGSVKTTLAKMLVKRLSGHWLNADKIRKKYNDWDFSKKGILRQAKRMSMLSNTQKANIVVADFVCPYHSCRKIYKPNFLIWMDTIKKGRLPTFDKTFEKPKYCDYIIKEKKNFSFVAHQFIEEKNPAI